MELWQIALLVYVCIVAFNVILVIADDDRTNYKISLLLFKFVALTIIGVLFGWITMLLSYAYVLTHNKSEFKVYTISALTDDQKNVLRQLGFEEGTFISPDNLEYEGFRFNKGDVRVTNSGRVAFRGSRIPRQYRHIHQIFQNFK